MKIFRGWSVQGGVPDSEECPFEWGLSRAEAGWLSRTT